MRRSPNEPACLTAEEIDAALSEWRGRVGNASENLLALYDVTAMKRMDGRDGFAKVTFTGVTAARTASALEAMRRMFTQLETLTSTIDRAESLRKSLTRLRRYDETRQEISHLLTGDCVALAPDETPLASRSLVSVSQRDRAISLQHILKSMEAEFETTKQAILAVDAAWAKWEPRLDAALAKATALEQRANSLGIPPPDDLCVAQAQIDALKARVLSDPLGVTSDDFGRTSSLLDAALAHIEDELKLRAEFSAEIDHAIRLQTDLQEAARFAAQTFEQAAARIADPKGKLLRPSSVDAASLAQLQDWRASLTSASRNASAKSIKIGLNRYGETVDALLMKERQATAANRAALASIAEFEGRLAIVEARAQRDSKLSGSPAAGALSRLAAQARTLLQQTPMPLSQIMRLVEACEARLRQEIV